MTLDFPEHVRVGYELEFCSMSYIPDRITEPLEEWFSFGMDRSLAPRYTLAHLHEVRSRFPMNKVSVDVIALLLEQLELHNQTAPFAHRRRSAAQRNCFTTRNCGLHVHVSSIDRLFAVKLFGRIVENVLPKVNPFPERVEFCSPVFNSPRGERYNALRWVEIADGHFEVRAFNSTLKLRGIVRSLQLIRNEAWHLASGSQAP